MEIWRPGKLSDVVVTKQSKNSHIEDDYYGGNLICESISRKENVALICAAPDMLSALKSIVDCKIELPLEVKNAVNAAIEKATNLNFS